ncbi:glycosyltransferase [Pseudoalteromonas sp. SSM20]|uniref:glycosyltransferase n=1 Tax=Pseudoalteromonas sp. SSM20 TaxID=3139394 RepID=UPI003BAA3EA7
MKVAYLMSRYPKITETFILNEVMAIADNGIDVTLYPLQKEKASVVHPSALALMDKVTFTPFISFKIVAALLKVFFAQPITFLKTLFNVIRYNLVCSNFLLGAVAFFPKAVYLSTLFKKKGIEHIHAHFANHPAMVAYVIYQLSGIGYSFTAHGSDLHKRQQMLKEKFDAAEFAVMISKYNEDFFYQHTKIEKSHKLHIVRCGVDTESFRPKSEKQEKVIKILCVASLREVKGHRYLIDACSLLKKRGISFRLTLIGDGPMRDNIESQIESLKLNEHVTLLGSQPQEVIQKNLAENDIFTLTSFQTSSGNREGIPVVIMEAMACGLPIVASNVSGIPELVEDGVSGLLCETQNPQSIADKLLELCNDDAKRRGMGIQGRKIVLEEFDLQKNANKLAKLFEKFKATN